MSVTTAEASLKQEDEKANKKAQVFLLSFLLGFIQPLQLPSTPAAVQR